jgi:hypothetical protein
VEDTRFTLADAFWLQQGPLEDGAAPPSAPDFSVPAAAPSPSQRSPARNQAPPYHAPAPTPPMSSDLERRVQEILARTAGGFGSAAGPDGEGGGALLQLHDLGQAADLVASERVGFVIGVRFFSCSPQKKNMREGQN